MASIFSKIVAGEIPGHKIAEDEKHLAFLDIRPLREGHTLVIPKKEVNYLFDLEETELAELWKFARKVAKAIDKAIDCERVGVAVIGLEVPHAHIHLIPINGVHDIDFSLPKQQFSEEQMKQTAQKIASGL